MKGRGFFDLHSPWLRPLWRRVAVTVTCLGWAATEASRGHVEWAMGFAVAGAYLVWALFIAWNPGALDDDTDGTGKDP